MEDLMMTASFVKAIYVIEVGLPTSDVGLDYTVLEQVI